MTDGAIGNGPEPSEVRQPLPPEVPTSSAGPAPDPDAAGHEPEPDWWRVSAPLPPEGPPAEPEPESPEKPAFKPAPDWSADAGPAPDPTDSERVTGVRDEWADTWATHGQDGLQAAHEIAVTIGEAVVSHLPNPEAAAERRGLDIRWLRLKFNLPGIVLALLMSGGSNSLSERLARTLATDGPFGLLGYLLLPLIVLGLFMVTPIGGPLG